jgi:hypothetical protein
MEGLSGLKLAPSCGHSPLVVLKARKLTLTLRETKIYQRRPSPNRVKIEPRGRIERDGL